MITQIGIVAGEIWSYLEGHDKEAPLESVISSIGKERDLVLMSIGWLAREGHIVLEGDAPEFTVKLTNEKGIRNEQSC
ncbi:MAG: winged helix-turn-helix domain-containing protein [Candidatus Omnitrophota bacterium]